jgi:hypothetical protein
MRGVPGCAARGCGSLSAVGWGDCCGRDGLTWTLVEFTHCCGRSCVPRVCSTPFSLSLLAESLASDRCSKGDGGHREIMFTYGKRVIAGWDDPSTNMGQEILTMDINVEIAA